ncbi:hypothetical protein BDB00DRAFT_757076, partial [Zychaea mexicana]|uniref:uncharacterized protein n=1 Tax=Zychaea mexicana TaxID=64656 RepID=UPI0022FE1002
LLAYAHSPWEELDVGRYELPFVLKFPNVNYPPSIEDPPGFGIRYVWTAHIEGPGGHPGITSKKINTPYRPIIASPPDKEWVYRTNLSRDVSSIGKKQHSVAHVLAKLNKQCYCPDEPFIMQLTMTTLQSDLKIVQAAFKFRKHHQGRLMVSGGTAQRYVVRDLLHGTLSNNQQPLDAPNQTVSFNIPTRNVSPTFTSQHIRVYYDLHFTITFEESHFLKRCTVQCEFAIPLNIANLPNDELMRVPDLITVQNYTQPGIKCPEFFDPAQPDDSDPPSYASSLHNSGQHHQQRSVYLTGPALAPYYPATTTTTTPTTATHNGSGNNNTNNNNNNVPGGGNGNMNGISGITTVAGCSSAISHQRRSSFPEVGEATLMHGVYSEYW